MDFLGRFLELSKERGLNITDVAKQTKLPRSTVSSYVNRKSMPSVIQLNILADFFGVSVDYLIGRTDDFGSAVPTPNSDNLSEDEKELLTFYNQLDEEDKRSVKRVARSLSSEKKESHFGRKAN